MTLSCSPLVCTLKLKVIASVQSNELYLPSVYAVDKALGPEPRNSPFMNAYVAMQELE
jgi:hypothetical protein